MRRRYGRDRYYEEDSYRNLYHENNRISKLISNDGDVVDYTRDMAEFMMRNSSKIEDKVRDKYSESEIEQKVAERDDEYFQRNYGVKSRDDYKSSWAPTSRRNHAKEITKEIYSKRKIDKIGQSIKFRSARVVIDYYDYVSAYIGVVDKYIGESDKKWNYYVVPLLIQRYLCSSGTRAFVPFARGSILNDKRYKSPTVLKKYIKASLRSANPSKGFITDINDLSKMVLMMQYSEDDLNAVSMLRVMKVK